MKIIKSVPNEHLLPVFVSHNCRRIISERFRVSDKMKSKENETKKKLAQKNDSHMFMTEMINYY